MERKESGWAQHRRSCQSLGLLLSGLQAFKDWFLGTLGAVWRLDHGKSEERKVPTSQPCHLLSQCPRVVMLLKVALVPALWVVLLKPGTGWEGQLPGVNFRTPGTGWHREVFMLYMALYVSNMMGAVVSWLLNLGVPVPEGLAIIQTAGPHLYNCWFSSQCSKAKVGRETQKICKVLLLTT